MARAAVTVSIQNTLVRASIKRGEGSRLTIAPFRWRRRERTLGFHVPATSHARSVATAHRTVLTIMTTHGLTHGERFASITCLHAPGVAMRRHVRHRSVSTLRHNLNSAVTYDQHKNKGKNKTNFPFILCGSTKQ